jgi:hypothetical protein
MQYNVKGNSTLVSSPYDSSYGLTNVIFNNPSQSFSNALQNVQPTEYKVSSCSPSDSDSNTACLPGSTLYNLQLNKPLLASRPATTAAPARRR